MTENIKPEIYLLIDSIEDVNVLQMVKEDIAWYADKKDILDELDATRLTELKQAIAEADNNDTKSWEDFKKEMNKWTKNPL